MTDHEGRLEAGLRELYASQRAQPTVELRHRLNAIPDEVAPDRPAWRMPVVAVGTAAGLVAAGLAALTFIRRLSPIAQPPSDIGSAPFDPVRPGGGLVSLSGVTFEGIDAILTPIVWGVVIIVLVLGVAPAVVKGFRDLFQTPGAVQPPEPPRPHAKPLKSRRRRLVELFQFTVVFVLVSAGTASFRHPPMELGSLSAPGIGLTERRSDGVSQVVFPYGTFQSPSGGPRDVYAVGPGQPLTYLVSVRNTWPIPVRLIGRWADSNARTDAAEPRGSTPTGLGLLRDPARLVPSVDNTVPFQPIEIAPGAEVPVVVAEVARDCADPGVSLPQRRPGPLWTRPSIEFVYEVFGIQGVAPVHLSPEVVVPSTCA